jgi:8-oxo-dGTP diphosphatase
MTYTYDYERPAVTVDVALLGLRDGVLQTLLIKRGHYPFEGMWALPGGFVDVKEDLEAAALRELQEETGVTGVKIEQFYTFGDPFRDPRTRIIAVVHYALVRLGDLTVKAGDDASDARWFPAYSPPQMAFDHDKVVQMLLNYLRFKVRHTAAVFELLPEILSIGQLAAAVGACLNKPIPVDEMDRHVAALGILRKTDAGYSLNKQALEPVMRNHALFPF